MARLNEPATTSTAATGTSSEAVESLKRRFLRQNRELARVNSSQSVKIRNLETQISQLVAENCQLHAGSNQLRVALDESRTTRTLQNVEDVQKQLQDKLKEFEGLVSGLGDIGKKRKSSKRQSEVVRSPRQSPNQKAWRSERGIGDVLNLPQTRQAEGWLPTIVENKQFPRRTLEATEISAIVDQDSSDSPDIGPPPRTFIDRRESLDRTQNKSQDAAENSQLPDLASANLETRRRRRETNLRRDSSLVSVLDLSPTKDPARPSELLSSQPLRAGAKRKLDVEDRPNDARMPVSEDATALLFRKKRDDAVPNAREAVNTSPMRKALAPKPVNTDAVVISPRKKDQEKDKPSKRPTVPTSRDRLPQRESTAAVHVEVPETQTIAPSVTEIELDGIKLEPKTPSALDIFSPASTQPPEARPEGRSETPPPIGLGAGTAADAAGEGRGSRRARAQVSYAEPSLVSKMRRPGKEMAPAVVAGRRSSSAQPELKREASEAPSTQAKMRMVVLDGMSQSKHLSTVAAAPAESARPEPASPLVAKAEAVANRLEITDNKPLNAAAIPASTNHQEKRRASKTEIFAAELTASGKTDDAKLEQVMQDLNIYDVQDSPPQRRTSESTGSVRPRSQASSRPTSAASAQRTTSAAAKPTTVERSRNSADLSKVRLNRRQTLTASVETKGPEARVVEQRPSSGMSSRSDAVKRVSPEEKGPAVGRRRSMML